MKDEEGTPRAWGRKALPLAAAISLLTGACAPQRIPQVLAPGPAASPFRGTLRVQLRAGGREGSFRAGCAVDPGRGIRIEVRDPFGATRLLLLLEEGGAILVDPARGTQASWGSDRSALPWGPDAMWLFLAGRVPDGGSLVTHSADRIRCDWASYGNQVRVRLSSAPGSPAPYATMDARGGRGERLRITLTGAEAGGVTPDTLARPDIPLRTAPLLDLLPWGTP
jgi:hypothetical protein